MNFPPSIGVVTASQALINAGVPADAMRGFADDLYCLAARRWIANTFSNQFIRFRDHINGQYEDSVTDCDDFSGCAIFFAHWCHRRTKERPKGALAVGRFWYQSRAGSHAIVVFLTREDGVITPVFYEPQLARIIEPTRSEIESAYFCQLAP